MAEILRKYADDQYPTRPLPFKMDTDLRGEISDIENENSLSATISGNPILKIIANALDDARVKGATKNIGEYKGKESGKVIKNFLKDSASEIPESLRSEFRKALIDIASENVSIPIGQRNMTFAQSEAGQGMDATLSNVYGGDLTFALDPQFLGLKFRKQF